MRVRALAAVAVGIGLFAGGTPAYSDGIVLNTVLNQYVRADADYILAQQEPDGGIKLAPRYTGAPPADPSVSLAEIHPYFSNIAARGLARATALLKDPRYAAGTLAWLRWYIAHMDANGFAYDHCVKASSPTQWQSGVVCRGVPYDSTDAYAGTFLSAANEWWQVTLDRATLPSLREGIRKAVAAIRATTQPNGLTTATPTYPVMYLMDNVEVYEGLLAAEPMLAQLGETTLLSTVQTQRAQILASFGPAFRLTGAGGAFTGYTTAYHPSGYQDTLCWRQFYPGAMAQAWPAAGGIGAQADNSASLAALEQEQSMWDAYMRPATKQPYPVGACDQMIAGSIGFIPRLALGYANLGLTERATRALQQFQTDAASINRLWPFNTRAAGELILVAAKLYTPTLNVSYRLGRRLRDWSRFLSGTDLCALGISRYCDAIFDSL